MTDNPSKPTWAQKETVMNIVLLALLVLSVGSGLLAFNNYPPLNVVTLFWNSLAVSIPAFIIFAVIIERFLRGFAESKETFPMILVVGSILFLILGWGMLGFSNGFLDTKQAQKYEVPILNKYYSHGTYYPGWSVTVNVKELGASDPLTFSIPTAEYKVIEHKDKCGLLVKPGFWGYKWLGSHHCD